MMLKQKFYDTKAKLKTEYLKIKRKANRAWLIWLLLAFLLAGLIWSLYEVNRLQQNLQQLNRKVEEKYKVYQQSKRSRVAVVSTVTAAPAPVPSPQPRPVVKPQPNPRPVTDVQQTVKAVMLQYWGEDQWESLRALIQRESGWNPFARNPHSGAAGLCQALPASKMASEGLDYLTNPIAQSRWCMKYILERYGNPQQAWQFWQTHGWF